VSCCHARTTVTAIDETGGLRCRSQCTGDERWGLDTLRLEAVTVCVTAAVLPLTARELIVPFMAYRLLGDFPAC
jgi:hypothetical protein